MINFIVPLRKFVLNSFSCSHRENQQIDRNNQFYDKVQINRIKPIKDIYKENVLLNLLFASVIKVPKQLVPNSFQVAASVRGALRHLQGPVAAPHPGERADGAHRRAGVLQLRGLSHVAAAAVPGCGLLTGHVVCLHPASGSGLNHLANSLKNRQARKAPPPSFSSCHVYSVFFGGCFAARQ